MVKDFQDEHSLEIALNTLQFYGKPIVVVKGQVFSILNIQIYYQSVFGLDQKEVIQKPDGKYYITNYGGGGSDVDINIGNVQVGTFDGVGSFANIGDISDFEVQDFEMRVVVKFDTLGVFAGIFAVQQNSGSSYRGGFMNRISSSNNLEILIFDNDVQYTYSSTLAFNNTDTYTIIVIKIGTSLIATVNGVEWINTTCHETIDYIPTIEGQLKTIIGAYNNISSRIGFLSAQISYVELVGKGKWYFQSQQGATIYDNSGNGNDGTLLNANLTAFWANKSDYAEPVRYTKGYEKFESDTTPGQYLYRLFINGSAVGTPITGYTKIAEYEPYVGVTPSEELLLQPDDTDLNTIYDTYAALSVLKNPNKFDYNILNAIDLTGIDTDDFTITKAATGIKEMKTKKSTYGEHYI